MIFRLMFLVAAIFAVAPAASEKPNVLYFLSDDMRADWGSYGMPVHTPNIDRLASKGLLFDRSYCQLSVCAPSRMSFMSSRRPDTYGIWNFIDTTPEDIISMPRHFRDNGYLTLGLGKTWHQDLGAYNANNSWSPDLPYFPYGVGKCPHGGQGGGHCVQTDDEIYDYHLMLETQKYLSYAINKTKATGDPFFVMAGFRKPHAPWQYPQRMYDLYNDSDIVTAKHDTFPANSPLIAYSKQLSVQLQNGTSFPYGPFQAVPQWVQQDQRHAYYASVSYVDENVGKILSILEESGLENNTIIVMHADHGYQLGEHGEWEKKSNFDLAVRVPLLIVDPTKPNSHGKHTESLTELVDVFPTISALAGLPAPPGVDGTDVSSIFDDMKPAKNASYHQYPACGDTTYNQTRKACNNTPKNKFDFMGYSVRTDEWRYTAWFKWDQQNLKAEWKGPFAAELYNHDGDHGDDMDSWENNNLAESNPSVAASLHAQLMDFFQQH